MSLTPCETADEIQAIHDRRIEIETLSKASQAIVQVSPEAARVLRDTARALLKVQIAEICKAAIS